jgi:hypothetical protein
VGYFGTFIYTDGQWNETADVSARSPYLRVDIHDSDIATIDYNPAGVGSGRFYLGFEPAIYFEDPEASQPVDADAEVGGLSVWAEEVVGESVQSDRVRTLLADPTGADPVEVFVEDSVVKLLAALGLPVPTSLQGNA